MDIDIDDIVLCTVKRIEGTTIFLDIGGVFDIHASMVLSEVAAGRIRNLRDYVSVGRKIVCKVLKISGDHVELSLRRVTGKEREGALERVKKEKILKGILKSIVKNPGEALEKIKSEYDVIEFLDEARENPKIFEKFVGKEEGEKIMKVLSEKDKKERSILMKIKLKSDSGSGVLDIKEVLDLDAEVHYLGSSKFSIEVIGEDFKEADLKMVEVLGEIEKKAKENKVIYEVGK
jgi:translation initiation factor 2 alpha subunit (eIF-2alpha)